jgi:sulfate adenylyltransferase subunit 2
MLRESNIKMAQIATNISSQLFGLDAEDVVWNTERAWEHLCAQGRYEAKRTTERRIGSLKLLPPELEPNLLRDEFNQPPNHLILSCMLGQARRKRDRVLFVQLAPLPNGKPCLHANDARGARFWMPLHTVDAKSCLRALENLQAHLGKPITAFPHGNLLSLWREHYGSKDVHLYPQIYRPTFPADFGHRPQNRINFPASAYLGQLEAESIHIIREACAEATNPTILYSMGKDSAVLLHLARKAFFPALPPLPLLHIDTCRDFQEMYRLRDFVAQESGLKLLIYTNPEAIGKNINPLDHESPLHTNITKTEGLKQALDHYRFDTVISGARREEDPTYANGRIFSFCTAAHEWLPNNQRPELWNLYNTSKKSGESIRVFPLSNWTELDIWQYIYRENIPIVPLYLAKPRPVVVRNGMIMLVDDERCHLLPSEEIQILKVRVRALSRYPLTGAMASEAETLEEMLLELINITHSGNKCQMINLAKSKGENNWGISNAAQ